MAFAKNIGKNKIFFYLHGGGGGEGSTFLFLGSSQIINDTPQKNNIKKQEKKPS